MAAPIEAPPCAPADPNPVPPSFEVPSGACDTHVHVFGPAEKYPYQPTRSYTPPDAPPQDLFRLHKVLGIERAVVVQASVHGLDNRAVLDAIALRPSALRGVVTLPPGTLRRELEQMHAGGVRGMRINFVDKGGMPYASMDEVIGLCRRVADLGWHLECLAHVEAFDDLQRLLDETDIPLVFGHLGYTRTTHGLDHPGYARFLEALKTGRCWAKLTGPYRVSHENDLPYRDVAAFASALVQTAPKRILWGTDWPHVMQKGPMPNDGALLDLLADWVPDAELRKAILVNNPEALYGFEPSKEITE
ncbi:amidohydrolase family protein [Rhodobacterales bacterium HKCCSP123]|nr:amidohydrolase family protein [Rhodobacterales bacterium HKCCSP123]